MVKNHYKKTHEDILRDLYLFAHGSAADVDNMSRSEIQRELRDNGADPDKLAESVLDKVKKSIGRQRMIRAKKERKDFMSRIAELPHLPHNAAVAMKKIYSLDSGLAKVQLRKFEESNPEDLPRLLEDFMLLEEVQKIDEKKN